MISSTHGSKTAAGNSDGRLLFWGAVPAKLRFLTCGVLGACLLAAAPLLLEAVFRARDFQVLAVEALSEKTDVLVVGSSRVFYGIDPSRYRLQVVPLGANFLDLTVAREILALHMRKAPNLKLVVLEFGIVNLYLSMREMEPTAAFGLGISPWPSPRDFVARPRSALAQITNSMARWRLTPSALAAQRDFMNAAKEPRTLSVGYVPSELVVGAPAVFAERKVRQGEELLGRSAPETHARNLAALSDLAVNLVSRRIPLVLIRFPKEASLRGLYPKEWHTKVYTAFKNLTDDLMTAGLPPPTFLDFSQDERFQTEEFRDPDHLNSRGADRLARLLEPHLGSILLQP